MPTESEMLKNIWLKMEISYILADKIDKLRGRIEKVEGKVLELEHQKIELDTGVSHMETEIG